MKICRSSPMENAQKLPDEIIQHIQSLISERDAARTCLLSKSWHGAWSTRPNLSLDQTRFRNRVDEFSIFTKKTMQRYEDLNRNIKSFKLGMVGNDDSLAIELILKAIKLGATDLTIEFPFSDASRYFVLPDEVLESETLIRLSVLGLTIDLERRNKAVACSNLKSLHLCCTAVKGDLIRDLISRCPSIEELTLYYTTSTTTTTNTSLFGDETSHDHEFDNLKCLRLICLGVKLHDHDVLWNKSPSLKVLVIWDDGSDHVRICNPSLERITVRLFCTRRIWNGGFDVPNIQKLKISVGCEFYSSCLKIKSSDREWEINGSDKELEIKSFERFSSLNQLVKTFSLSLSLW